MSKEILNQRTDKFTIVLNDSGADVFKNAHNIVRTLRCCEYLCIIFIACIKHDKDIDEETQHVKTPHYHLVVVVDRSYRLGTFLNLICDLFKCNANQVSIDKCTSIEMQTRYLIHLDDFDKHQYDISEIETNDTDELNRCMTFIKKIKSTSDLISIVHQFKSLVKLIEHIGLDNYKKYRLVINDLRREFEYNKY